MHLFMHIICIKPTDIVRIQAYKNTKRKQMLRFAYKVQPKSISTLLR
jgi:hypothetical protein